MTTTPEFAADEIGTDRKKLVVVGGVLGALVLGAGGYLLLQGGGGEDEAFVVPSASKAKTSAVTGTAAKPAVKKTAQLPAVSNVKLGRDPFIALYTVPVAAPAAAPAAPTTTGTTAGTTTPTTTSPGTTTSKPVATTYALKLTRVYGSGKDLTGVFSVGGKTQTARVGSVFGARQELKLLSLQQGAKGVWTAVVQVGDGEPFDAVAGNTYHVL